MVLIPAAVAENISQWNNLEQNVRDNFIEQRLEEIGSIEYTDLSDSALEKTFGGKISKDADYKIHRQGKTTNDKIEVEIIKQQVYQKYFDINGEEASRLIDIDSGYALISDNIKLLYNSAGLLGEIITINRNSQNGYMVRKYNKNKKLIQSAYNYKGFYIYLNNDKFAGIKCGSKYYNEKGKEIPKSYMQIYKGLEL